MGIKMIGRLEPVAVPGQDRPTFITIYDFPDEGTPRLRFGIGNSGEVFDLPQSEARRMCSVVEDWLGHDGGQSGVDQAQARAEAEQ